MTHQNNNSRPCALVTGASSGIGRAAAIRLSEEGMNVALVARNKGDLETTAQSIKTETLVIPMDLEQLENVQNCIRQCIDHFGRLDVLVNAAGIIGSGTVESTPLGDWQKMMNINLHAIFLLMQAAIPHLEKTKGAIVNVSSVTGLRAFPGIASYCVSKAGVDQLTRCAALELAKKWIRVNAVNPGLVQTNLHKRGGMDNSEYEKFVEHSKSTHPLGRSGKPEEVAELIAFLGTDKSGWITGTTISIDGGRAQTCAR